MFNLNRLTIKSRLLLILLLISISSVLFIGVLAYRYAQATIQERILAQLTTVRAARSYEIETYLNTLTKQIATVSQDDFTSRALLSFSNAFAELGPSVSLSLSEEQEAELEQFYETVYLPELTQNADTAPSLETYIPGSKAGRYLQYHYIVNNPNPIGQKEQLRLSSEFSGYAASHQRYHEFFRNMPEIFGFYDVFLIDLDGNVVYTVFKEVDLGSNLNTGPYRGSGLAEVYRAALAQPDAGALVLDDFSFYRPSYGQPAAFIASPVYRGQQLLGVLAFQGPVDEINRIMTGGRAWRESGLGETGETYLVAEDGLMRSQARQLVENPEAYFASLDALNLDTATTELIRDLNSPILLQSVSDEVLGAAFSGETGTREARDFAGTPTLVSSAPLDVPGLDWAVVAEIDLAEAYEPLTTFQRILLFSTAALVLFITALAMYIAQRFVRPIDRFIEGAEAITSGASEHIEETSSDEFGRLALSLNRMVGDLNARTERERARGDAQAQLLARLLPEKVAEQLRGNETFVEQYPDASVIFANLRGFGGVSEQAAPDVGLARLDGLVSLFDQAALDHGVEKVKTVGTDYLAVCGAATSRLDHARRSLEFAESLQQQLEFFNQQHGLNLTLSVGLASGKIVAGVVGRSLLVYDIWGAPVDQAIDSLGKNAPAGAVWVSAEFKGELDDSSKLVPLGNAQPGSQQSGGEQSGGAQPSGAQSGVWALKGTSA